MTETFPGIRDQAPKAVFDDGETDDDYTDVTEEAAMEAALHDFRSKTRLTFSDGGYSAILDEAA